MFMVRFRFQGATGRRQGAAVLSTFLSASIPSGAPHLGMGPVAKRRAHDLCTPSFEGARINVNVAQRREARGLGTWGAVRRQDGRHGRGPDKLAGVLFGSLNLDTLRLVVFVQRFRELVLGGLLGAFANLDGFYGL